MRLWQTIFALAALWAALYLPGLGTPELKGEEGRRILPAVEMLRSGEWILPEMEGQPYLRKPPLINWAIAAGFSLAGTMSEWSARLPSALSVLALALAGGFWLRRFVAGDDASPAEQARAMFLAGALLLVNAGLMSKGRLAEIEALYVALAGLAIAQWINLWRREASPWLTYTLPWLWLGLGLLCKGPPHLFFFYGIVIAVLWKARSLRELAHPAHGLGLALMLAVFLPWAVAVKNRAAIAAPKMKAAATWWDQLTERFSFEQFSLGNWLLGPFEAAAMILPWGIVLVFFWKKLEACVAARPGRDLPLVQGLRWGIAVTAVAILLIPATRPRFVQPLTLPALALCALALWHYAGAAWQKHATRAALGLLAVISLGSLAVPFFVPAFRESIPTLAAAVLPCAGAALAVWRLWVKFSHIRQPLKLALAGSLLGVLLAVAYAAIVLPIARGRDDTRPVGRRLSAAVGAETLSIVNPGRNPSPLHWRFYLTCPHRVVPKLSLVPGGAAYVLVPAKFADTEAERSRLTGTLGLKRELFRFTDALRNEFALWTRLDEPALDEENSGGPVIRIHPAPKTEKP